MLYGKVQDGLFNTIAILAGVFTVKLKKADVNCIFDEKKFGYDVHTIVRVRPSTLIAIGFSRALIFLKYIFQADVRKSVLPIVAVKSLRLRRMKLKQQIEIRKVEKNERKYKDRGTC